LEAAHSTAAPPQQPHPALDVIPNNKKKGPPLRRGKWTPEEEAYANRLILEFKSGLLPLTDGTTLRTFLSKLLNCDPMRISKKFVGSNCIGKQVFRRRTADLNRLTPEQIQQSRAELSELERRFLERVTQTNRVKSSGVGGAASAAPEAIIMGRPKIEHETMEPPSPPWLQPPFGYKQGAGAAFAAANLSGSNSRAAAAGRAMLAGTSGLNGDRRASGMSSQELLAMAEFQRQASQSTMMQNPFHQGSATNLLAATRSGSSNGLSSAAFSQLAQSVSGKSWSDTIAHSLLCMWTWCWYCFFWKISAARLSGLQSNNASMNNLMLKTGLSREQLTQLARDRGLSSDSLSNMIQRQNSFDALMSLDFQSLQSIDNLANLIQTGTAGSHSNIPESGMKNADFGYSSRQNITGASSGDLSNAARRLASAGRMESLLQSMSNNNFHNNGIGGNNDTPDSNVNLNNLLQSMHGGSMLGMGDRSSAASLLGSGNGPSAVSLANLLRQDSSTGLTALRMQDGLNQRNSSVDDFLSLVAAGDIPHQDPSLLNVPLMHQQGPPGSSEAAAKLMAQQQMLQASGNSALANALASRSFGNLQNSHHSGGMHSTTSAAALAMAQARAAANGSKRNLDYLSGGYIGQGDSKR
jgi:hypothetical protein